MTVKKEFIKGIVKETTTNHREHLLSYLWSIQREFRMVDEAAISSLAECTNISVLDISSTASFYHFFTHKFSGEVTIYLNDSVTSYLAGLDEVKSAFEKELDLKFGDVSSDGKFGLFYTSCIGMCDQEPAAIINDIIFVNLTPTKVASIVSQLKSAISIEEIARQYRCKLKVDQIIPTEVCSYIKNRGAVFFNEQYRTGEALQQALKLEPTKIIAEIKASNLRGRGGAGFPTGMKWEFCQKNTGDHYIIANADEGEPGTFKDRILLSHYAAQVFEGMIIAAIALQAKEGILYLRGEYTYLLQHLKNILEDMRKNNLLGDNILGSGYSFDISIKLGAGAYICGEESALIESAEGKRGEPRNRPPFPVEKGFLGNPTIVNNPETYACVTKITKKGASWFQAMGTEQSSGTKLLSISGDCKQPGVYEVEFGTTIADILSLCEARDCQAIQVGGPSGKLIGEQDFQRRIAFEDLATGGAFVIFSKQRNLFEIVKRYLDFFVNESCGFCVPCRAGNVLLQKTLEKVLQQKGTARDITLMKECAKVMKITSRCGLGQTSANPVLSLLENFPHLFSDILSTEEFISTFDMSQAVEESCKFVKRDNIFNGEGRHE